MFSYSIHFFISICPVYVSFRVISNSGLDLLCIFFYLIAARALPFRVGVNFNNNEADTGTDAATTGELNEAPGGIVGFKLNYWQGTC